VAEAVTAKESRFPTFVGVLLSAAVALHVAALGQALLGRPVNGAALFLTGQFIITLSLLRLYNGKWIIQDIRLFFALFLFLYGGALPLVVALGFAGAVDGIAGAGYMYGTAFLGFNLVQWWYRQPFHDIPPAVFARIKPTYLNLAILIGAFVLVIGYAVARGVSISFTIDRGQRGWLNTQTWVVLIFVVNGLAMYMFAGWSSLTRAGKIAVVSSVVMFVGFQVMMGNRRDFLPMFVFIACVIANKRHMIIRAGTVIIGSIAFVLFMMIGIVRQVLQDPAMLVRFNALELVITQNEFVAPIYTLIHYVTHWRTPRMGMTYLAAPSQLIPRAFWPDKPESLSLQFMRDAFGSTVMMGFAYTPVTEAFLNFSWVGPFLMFSIWSLILVKLVKSADAHPAAYLVAYAMVVDFQRGDFAGIFYALVFVGGSYAVMTFVSRLRWFATSDTTVIRPSPVLLPDR
jgi:hypothetical protein